MDLLTVVLAICIHNNDGSSDCDIRVKKHIPGLTIEKCEAMGANTGRMVQEKLYADPVESRKLKEVRYRSKCYTDAFASQVIANIPAWMANSNSSYTITYYDE